MRKVFLALAASAALILTSLPSTADAGIFANIRARVAARRVARVAARTHTVQKDVTVTRNLFKQNCRGEQCPVE